LAGNLFGLAAAVLLAGLFFAPTLIVAMALVERLVPASQLTEGMTWLLAGLNVGVALGAVASGQVVDGLGASAGFQVALAAGALVLLVALWGYRRFAQARLSGTSRSNQDSAKATLVIPPANMNTPCIAPENASR
jgi:predicted MFS family arabinose efflux permease